MNETIIWRYGEKFEKTPKSNKPILNDKNIAIDNIIQKTEYNVKKKDKIDSLRENEIMQREMLVRSCQNPFLNNNYNKIIETQAEYLMPKNSGLEKN